MSDTHGARPQGGNGCMVLGVLLGIALLAAGAVIDFVSFDEPPPPPPVVSPLPQQEAEAEPAYREPDLAEQLARELEAARRAEPVQEPAPLLWHAEVIEASDLAVRTACVLAVYVSRGHDEALARHVTLDCGNRVVHDGPVDEGGWLEELPLGDGWYSYRAGVRSEPLHADTGTLEATIGSTVLYVRDLSVPRSWPPMVAANAGRAPEVRHRLHRLAVPIGMSGPVPPAVAEARRAGPSGGPQGLAACELTGDTVPSDRHDCRLALRCGGVIVYGASGSGYNDCVTRDGRIVSAHDANESAVDTDPRFVLDLDRRSLEVSDTNDEGSWTARFEVLPDPRCAIASTFVGTNVDEGGARRSWELRGRPQAGGWVVDAPGIGSAGAALDCDAGRIELGGAEGAPDRLWLGPRLAAIAGQVGGGTVAWGFR